MLAAEVDVRARGLLLLLPAIGGCWKTDLTELPEGLIAFDPAADAPEGWVVQGFEVDQIDCPDGFSPTFYLVYPEAPAGPMNSAVLLHSGAFDYVLSPSANDPLSGDHYQPVSRLSRDWSVERVFVTLGMYPNDDAVEEHDGAVAAALAARDVAFMAPANCWGDWWHNAVPGAENDILGDQFQRNGRQAAEAAFRMMNEPGFASALRVELPIELTGTTYIVGLGEGGRGVAEILNADDAYRAAGVVIDSSVDDMRPYYDAADPGLYREIMGGLNRIFPDGRDTTMSGSITQTGVLPEKVAYVYSSLDDKIPVGAHDAAVARLQAYPGGFVYDAKRPDHVFLNADPELAAQVLDFVVGPAAAE